MPVFQQELAQDDTPTSLDGSSGFVSKKRESIFTIADFRAIFKKNFTLQKRARLANCCIILTPLILICLFGVINVLIQNNLNSSSKPSLQKFEFPLPDPISPSPPIDFTDFYTSFEVVYNGCNSTCQTAFGTRDLRNSSSGFLGTFPYFLYRYPDDRPRGPPDGANSEVPNPVFPNQWTSEEDFDVSIAKRITTMQGTPIAIGNQDPNIVYSIPLDAVIVKEFNPFAGIFSYTIQGFNFKAFWQYIRGPGAPQNNAVWQYTRALGMSFMNSNFLRYIFDTNSPVLSGSSFAPLLERVQPSLTQYLYVKPASTTAVIDFASLLFIPFSLCFLFPLFVNQIMTEKENRIREFSIQMGLHEAVYIGVNLLYQQIFFIFVLITLIIGLSAWQSRIFTQTAFIVWFPVYLGWGFAQSALTFFWSSFFKTARAATYGSLFVSLICVFTSLILNLTTYKFPGDTLAPFWFYLFPLLPFCRAVYLMYASCDAATCFLTIDPGSQIEACVIALFVGGLIYFIVGLYLDQVLPRQYGVPKHPLFFLGSFHKGDQNFNFDCMPSDAYFDSAVDAVRTEVENMDFSNPSSVPSLVVRDVKKIYPFNNSIFKSKSAITGIGKFACKGVSFTIPKGEIFALLGPNGAGKSTCINMITGMTQVTKGDVIFGGKYSVRTDLNSVHQNIGICPQHDVFYRNLTVREQILFYVRLKRVPASEEEEHVKALIDGVALSGKENSLLSELSGGMRRRVSIAQAFAGSPDVVIVDEPTTGVDAHTGRAISAFMASKKGNRAILMTTHNLDEADRLSDTIAIMANGKLRAIGSSLDLKAKFAKGFNLEIAHSLESSETEEQLMDRIYEMNRKDPENGGKGSVSEPISAALNESEIQLPPVKENPNQEDLLNFVLSVVPGAALIEAFPGKLIFKIERCRISVLFSALLQGQKYGIDAWSLDQSSLEQVFLRIAKSH